ncbi:MAG TPA: zinc-binding dehydrogenase, partial [Acidimicrobiales bacterium]|nr:zinc-binding dehydrogenase [Acidimicrobiales bacterium]
ELEEVVLRPPAAGEVSVRVRACAICHSDIAYMSGAWGGDLPAVYGHEAAGVVEDVGDGVDALRRGDHVVVTLVRACGRCDPCRWGEPTLCEGSFASDASPPLRTSQGAPLLQAMRTAAFAELVTVDASQAIVVPGEIPFDRACLLACGVLTGLGAVVHTARVRPGSSVIVIGTGGVGLNCVQGARLAGARTVIALDLSDDKLAAARLFGATEVLNPSLIDVGEKVAELTDGRGAEYVLVATGSSVATTLGFGLLRRGGTLVLVGMPPSGTAVSFDPVAIADGSLRILGSKMGASRPHLDVPRAVQSYLDGELMLDELISQRYGLAEINEAVSSAKRGEQLRPVIVFPGAAG